MTTDDDDTAVLRRSDDGCRHLLPPGVTPSPKFLRGGVSLKKYPDPSHAT
jgi:hypothetical protein